MGATPTMAGYWDGVCLCRWLPRQESIGYSLLSSHGVWRSLVARVVRDDEAAGSNPVTPTTDLLSGGAPDIVGRHFLGAYPLVRLLKGCWGTLVSRSG